MNVKLDDKDVKAFAEKLQEYRNSEEKKSKPVEVVEEALNRGDKLTSLFVSQGALVEKIE